MEIRDDLARILLDGLPRAQREQALRVMQQSTVDKLNQKRASVAKEQRRQRQCDAERSRRFALDDPAANLEADVAEGQVDRT